jgi:hypothetical protein
MWVGRRGVDGLCVEQHMKQLRKRRVVFSSERLNTLPSAEALTSDVASPDPLWRGASTVGVQMRRCCCCAAPHAPTCAMHHSHSVISLFSGFSPACPCRRPCPFSPPALACVAALWSIRFRKIWDGVRSAQCGSSRPREISRAPRVPENQVGGSRRGTLAAYAAATCVTPHAIYASLYGARLRHSSRARRDAQCRHKHYLRKW